MKLGAFPLLLLNSIRSEKSSSTMGSGRGLAGRLRGGGGKPLPLEPEEVEGRERRSRPSSEEPPTAPAGVEGGEEEMETKGEWVAREEGEWVEVEDGEVKIETEEEEEEVEEEDEEEAVTELRPRKESAAGVDEMDIPESGELLEEEEEEEEELEVEGELAVKEDEVEEAEEVETVTAEELDEGVEVVGDWLVAPAAL